MGKQTMDSAALLNCPFCGGKGIFKQYEVNDMDMLSFVECEDCEAHSKKIYTKRNRKNQEQGRRLSYTSWNIRT